MGLFCRASAVKSSVISHYIVLILSAFALYFYIFVCMQPSVSVWLSVLGLSQYEEVMLEAGYDDIDFICDITLDDLQDLGITKIGKHCNRLVHVLSNPDIVSGYIPALVLG